MEFCQKNIKKEDFKKSDIVTGTLLGDGYMNKSGQLSVFHSIKQEKYVYWLMDLFSKYYKVYPKERICYNNDKTKSYRQVGFNTESTNYNKLVRNFFYKPRKRITIKQLNKLSPLGLAIWYMDDGNLSFIKNKNGEIRGRQIRISTHSFTYEENEIIVKYFNDRWGIKCKIHKDKGKYIIWMNGSEAKKFLNIIKDYLHESMYYKLCYRYFGYKSSENLCGHECMSGHCPYNIV